MSLASGMGCNGLLRLTGMVTADRFMVQNHFDTFEHKPQRSNHTCLNTAQLLVHGCDSQNFPFKGLKIALYCTCRCVCAIWTFNYHLSLALPRSILTPGLFCVPTCQSKSLPVTTTRCACQNKDKHLIRG